MKLNFRVYDASRKTRREIEKLALQIRNTPSNGVDQVGSISSTVSSVLLKIREGGDHSLIEYANKYDDSGFVNSSDLFVTRNEIEAAYKKLTQKQINSIKIALRQIRFLAKKQMERFKRRTYKSPLGFRIEEAFRPLKRIGGYVPGGLASYPSTVLMICITASEAGVRDVILATPARNGTISPSVLVAADLCGVKQILKVGGAQGIAALAYGTESVERVDLIAGPGNAYVTEAKREIGMTGVASIDMLAGPTELLILADSTAEPKLLYEDLISQAEHGNKTLCGFVSDSSKVLEQVTRLAAFESDRSRERIDSIARSKLFGVKVNSLSDDGQAFAQAFAPEHLELMVSRINRKQLTRVLDRAGILLMGIYTPCSSTDYVVGTNHILPTEGQAAWKSSLSVEDFLKRVVTVEGTRSSLKRSLRTLANIAQLENLPNHARAAQIRFEHQGKMNLGAKV